MNLEITKTDYTCKGCDPTDSSDSWDCWFYADEDKLIPFGLSWVHWDTIGMIVWVLQEKNFKVAFEFSWILSALVKFVEDNYGHWSSKINEGLIDSCSALDYLESLSYIELLSLAQSQYTLMTGYQPPPLPNKWLTPNGQTLS